MMNTHRTWPADWRACDVHACEPSHYNIILWSCIIIHIHELIVKLKGRQWQWTLSLPYSCAERKCGGPGVCVHPVQSGNCIPFRSMDPVIRWLRHPFKGNGLDWRILIPLTRSVRRERNVWEWLPEKLGLCWPYVVLWAPSHSFTLGCSVSSK